MACRRLRPGLRLRASLRGTIVADGSLRANRALLVAHGPPRTRVPEGRSKIGRRFSAGFLRFQIGPVPEGRGERCGQKMIRVAVFPEQTDIFLSEALCTVMFFLVGNVSNCVSQLRNANAESTITGLPAKFPELGKGFMDPVRGSCFEPSREFSGGEVL